MIEFHAHREKLLQERLTVKSQNSENYRELHLHARVLGNISTVDTSEPVHEKTNNFVF